MKHIIIGTAGHVDHGKTALIRALTKIDTDRLKEEKQRGISIENGFAYFDLPSGRRAGLIDVPGHERFIKNMLAGVGGIDIVILVIAADEGVMPQTREHLNIVSLLQVKRGIVALTKADLVEQDWLELVTEQVREELADTFLADAPIIPVSSLTGQGLPALTAEIDRLTEEVEAKDTRAAARLPIDRVFTISGFGTVVTGTLLTGVLSLSDKLEIMPGKTEVRVRALQVHGEKVEKAFAGQRVAVNLAGVDVTDVRRGDVLAAVNTLKTTLMLDARVQVLANAPRALQHRTRIRLYIGASEVMGRVVPLEQESVEPGESALIQLRLEEPIAAAEGDLFVLRYYSPMATLGGGTVLQTNPRKKTRFKTEQIDALRQMEKGSPQHRLLQMLAAVSDSYPLREDFIKAHPEINEIEELIEQLLESEQAVSLTVDKKEILLASSYLQTLEIQVEEILQRFHRKNPLRLGMAKEELHSRMLKQTANKTFTALLLIWLSDERIKITGNTVAAYDFKVQLTAEQMSLYREISEKFQAVKFEPPAKSDLLTEYAKRKDLPAILELMQEEGSLLRLTDEILYNKDNFDQAEQLLFDFFREHTEISLAEYRDLLATSRKYALALLEYFDTAKITQRQGEKRILRKKS